MEFTTTATERPELLAITYQTFSDCLVDLDLQDCKLYINVDPVPYESEKKQKEVLDVANQHFGEVVHRIGPEGGNFARAVDWLFRQPEGYFFFNLEDDWEFEGTIPMEEYKKKLLEVADCAECVTMNNGGGSRIHFPPGLFYTKMVQDVLQRHEIPAKENPEQYLIDKFEEVYGQYKVTCHESVDRKDIGRDWAADTGVEKDLDWGGPGHFIRWDTSNVDHG